MTTLLLPFHQDESLGDRNIVLPEGHRHAVVSPTLPDSARWERLAALYDAAADEVAASLAGGSPTTVVSGDCLALLATLAGTQRAGLEPSLVWLDAGFPGERLPCRRRREPRAGSARPRASPTPRLTGCPV